MTFLGGELLAFLGALGLPILVHLLNLRRRRAREIPTLRFLKEIESTRLRRVRLTRWLLLLTRMLFLLALVLAFARPLLTGGSAFFGQGDEAQSLILLLDDSASSRLPSDGGMTVWEAARELASARIEGLDARDRVWLVPLSRPDEAAGPLSPDAARVRLIGMKPGWAAARLDESLARCLELLAEAPAIRRQILLLSDLRLVTPAGWEHQLPADLLRSLVVLPSGENQAAPQELQLAAGLLREDRPATLSAVLAGSGPMDGLGLSLDVEGETRARRTLAGGTSTAWRRTEDLDLRSTERGWLRGMLRLDGDAVEMDNELPFVLHMPERRRVALIAGGAEEGRVLAAAILPDARYRRGLELMRLDPTELAALEPSSVDQLVLTLGLPLTGDAMRRLRECAALGVHVLLLSSGDADPAAAGRQMAELGLPGITGMATTTGAWRMERLDRGHDVLASILEPGEREEPISVHRLMELAPADPPGVRRRTLAEAGGRPVIVAFEGRAGRALLVTTATHPGWSGLGASGLLAPLMQQGLRWLDGDERLPASMVCGVAGRVTPPRGMIGRDWKLVREGATWRVALDPLKGWLDLPPLPEPGHYQLMVDGRAAGWVAARLPVDETVRPPADAAQWRTPDAGGWRRLDRREVAGGAQATDLGPLLLVLALALLAVEGWLASGRGQA